MQELLVVVSVKNILRNIALWKGKLKAGTKFYAVVKANAYGHGAERVAEAIESAVDGFAVATVEEGVALRVAGVEKEILLLSPVLTEEEAVYAARHGLTLCLCSLAAFFTARRAAEKYGLTFRGQIKVDTGMNRLGVRGAPLTRLCRLLAADPRFAVTGVYSHLYLPGDRAESEKQRQRFLSETKRVSDILGPLPRHLSATGGILLGEEFLFDAVRVGIGIYGYLPAGVKKEVALFPAMKIYAAAEGSHRFSGGGAGYAKATKEYKDITVYRLGYADGFLRGGGGAELGAEGNLCMDGCIAAGRKKYGEKKVVLSSAERVAEQSGTIACEVLCAVGKRAHFEYV